jgi:hypothetical protein
MASYYDNYTYYGEPDYYGSSNTYQEPNNYVHPPNTYYSEEPQYYEDAPHCHASLEPTDNEPQYYKDALHCHTGLEPIDDENWPMHKALIQSLPCYEDLHPMYQDPIKGLGDYAAEGDQDGEGHEWCDKPNESIEYPPHHPSLNDVADNVHPSSWVNPDPNNELSDEEWEILVVEQNAADDAALEEQEWELEEYFALFNSIDPLEQDELEHRMCLLEEGDDLDDSCTFYPWFLKAVNLMAAAKPTPSFSLDTMALPPQFNCSPDPLHHIDSTVSQLPQKTCSQCIYLVTAAPKRFTHFRTQNRPTQH